MSTTVRDTNVFIVPVLYCKPHNNACACMHVYNAQPRTFGIQSTILNYTFCFSLQVLIEILQGSGVVRPC